PCSFSVCSITRSSGCNCWNLLVIFTPYLMGQVLHFRFETANAVPIGKNFATIAPKGVAQLVAPATNINGVVIRTCFCNPQNGTVNLVAATSAPSGISDATKSVIFSGNGNTAAGSNTQIFAPKPLYIPKGLGLWVATSTNAGVIALTWDVLS
ncbi:hypothetical protein, partial [Paracidovorax anthurii]|uniref:hypothetical protein n=1 Tax=Paracidovorax anthurii TaxID=78229 RepID=UPI0039F05389